MSESTIRADAPLVTLINVFTVDPENQQRLVVNYAQWETRGAFNAISRAPTPVCISRNWARSEHRTGPLRGRGGSPRDRREPYSVKRQRLDLLCCGGT